MKCKDVCSFLLDGKGESGIMPAPIENHLRSCSSCTRFLEDLSAVEGYMDSMPSLSPPEQVRDKTFQLCLASLEAQERAAPGVNTGRKRLPKIIWAALFLLIGLTAGIVTTLFTDLNLSEGLTPKSAMIATIMIQNAVMLFFAPVLLRKFRTSKTDPA